MLRYSLLTRWRFEAPVSSVWALIYDAENIARDWPGIKRFRILNIEDGLKTGCRIAVKVKSFPGDLDFLLEVSRVEPESQVSLVCRGDLVGEGRWLIQAQQGSTLSEFSWNVSTTEWYMNLIGLALKPLLIRSHDRTMANGYRLLSERLKRASL